MKKSATLNHFEGSLIIMTTFIVSITVILELDFEGL